MSDVVHGLAYLRETMQDRAAVCDIVQSFTVAVGSFILFDLMVHGLKSDSKYYR